jgi:hypothetical protein
LERAAIASGRAFDPHATVVLTGWNVSMPGIGIATAF